MACAGAQLAAGLDLAALTDVAAKAGEILVINVADVVCTILANLAATAKAAAAAGAPTPASATTGTTLCTAKAAWS